MEKLVKVLSEQQEDNNKKTKDQRLTTQTIMRKRQIWINWLPETMTKI
jgi:hypothetical protein